MWRTQSESFVVNGMCNILINTFKLCQIAQFIRTYHMNGEKNMYNKNKYTTSKGTKKMRFEWILLKYLNVLPKEKKNETTITTTTAKITFRQSFNK